MTPDRNSPPIIVVARQAGTAIAFEPVIRLLSEAKPPTPLSVFAYPAAAASWRHSPFSFTPIDSFGEARGLIESLRPSLILTGSSLDTSDDRLWWLWGRKTSVPVVAFVDQWTNYWQRFSTQTTGPSWEGAVPDKIAVVDQLARSRMIDSGCPAELLLVTGTPALDWLCAPEARVVDLCRERLLGKDECDLALFVCEPKPSSHGDFDNACDPDVSLQTLADAFGIGSSELNRWHVLLKRHPRQEERHEAIAWPAVPTPKVTASCSIAPRSSLLYAADAVIGHQSMLLLEAAAAGKPVIAIQGPGCPGHDLTRRPGIRVAESAAAVEAALEDALRNPSTVPSANGLGLPAEAGRAAQYFMNQIEASVQTAGRNAR